MKTKNPYFFTMSPNIMLELYCIWYAVIGICSDLTSVPCANATGYVMSQHAEVLLKTVSRMQPHINTEEPFIRCLCNVYHTPDRGLHWLWGVQENETTLQLYLIKKHSWKGSKSMGMLKRTGLPACLEGQASPPIQETLHFQPSVLDRITDSLVPFICNRQLVML